MAGLRVGFFLGVMLGVLTGCGGGGGGSNGGGGSTPTPQSTGSLTIIVSELPSGASASITVSGPSGYSASVTSTQTLQVAPGAYTVAAAAVSAGNSNYYPAIASQSATVAVSTPASVTVDYATIIPKTTKTLDAAGMSSLTVSPDGSTLTMSTASAVASSLQPNDILVSTIATAAPHGLLVKILSASTTGQTVTVSIEPASLEQAVQQATIQYSAVLGPSNTTASPTIAGRKRRQPRRLVRPYDSTTGACPDSTKTLPVKLNLSNAASGNSSGVAFTLLSGEMDFCPTFNFTGQIQNFQLISANATVSMGIHSSLSFLDGGKFSEELDLPIQLGPEVVVDIGIPVVVQPVLTPFVGFQVQSAAAQSALNLLTNDSIITVGATYSSLGWTPVATVTSTNSSPGGVGVDAANSITAKAGVKFGLEFYHSVAPYISGDGYLQLAADPSASPCLNLGWGLEGAFGLEGSILGVNLDYPITEAKFPSPTPIPIPQPSASCTAPVLTTISSTTAVAGSGSLTLAVTGSNFVPDSTVNWNGQALATTYVDTTDLTAVIPGSDLATGGTFPVTVNSPDSPGGTSAPVNFTVSQVMVTVAPASVAVPTAATQQFIATVTGTTNTAVSWGVNGIAGGNTVVGTISSSGLYTAPATIPSPASVTVSATSQEAPASSGSAAVSIIDGNYSYVQIDYPGALETQITGINDAGNMVGSASFPNIPSGPCEGQLPVSSSTPLSSGFLYTGSGFSSLDYSGACETIAVGINNTNQVIGIAAFATTSSLQNFIFNGGSFTSLDFSGLEAPLVVGINDSGTIVGNYGNPNNSTQPGQNGFSYSANQATVLDYPGASYTNISGINNAGEIYGQESNGGANPQDWTYSNNTFEVLNTLGITSPFEVWGINNNGVVIGRSGGGCQTSFAYDSGDIKTIAFPGSSCTQVYGINNLGQVVGVFLDMTTGYGHGFVATPTGK